VRVIVTGSRTWDRPTVVGECLDIIAKAAFAEGDTELVVVHGCAKGADMAADDWVRRARQNWPVIPERHPADWKTNGRSAGMLRNLAMARLGADLCLGFIRDGSRGAMAMVRMAEEHDIPTKVVDYASVTEPPMEAA
jgi:hypothetical protein